MLQSIARAGPSRLPALCLRRPVSTSTSLLRPVPSFARPITTSRSPKLTSPTFPSRLRTIPIILRRTSASTSPPGPLVSELADPKAGTLPPLPPTALDRFLPKWAEPAKPYILLTRFDKPIGSALLYWPCGASHVLLT